MNGIILAAGMGRRLRSMGWDSPKCLLPCPGGTLLGNTLSALRGCGLSRVAIVVGYKREQVEAEAKKHALPIDFIVNKDYATTNTLYSLYLARELLRQGSLLFNGDVWFRHSALEALCGDRTQKASESALLAVSRPCGREEVKVVVDVSGRVSRIGKELDADTAGGESVGIADFNAPAGLALARNLEQCVVAGQSHQFYEYSLDQILDQHPVRAAFIDLVDAIEIDTPEDYAAAQRLWSIR